MNMHKIVICLLAFTALSSCKPRIRSASISSPEDIPGKWKLIGILQDTSTIDEEFGEQKPFIVINNAKNQLQGFSGCNSFSGGIEAENDSIKILPLTATQIGCSKKGEGIFFSQLAKTNRFEVGRDSLKFLANHTVLLSFARNR